ncbi:helix-turn-helix domain-containing protein [Ruminococcus gauvreauii]|uniref:Helix-turn-helix domain-containing protein n=2 Tax=Ruminococcus gauvreauii TaxID=438033 RepID=A0ABY5VML7_9FIRM|nr:helix-turn-helix transcriptional regulator [Ruminococcus gauvreauii]UWP61348.1 helix-turn-helix domain-containing protein [Ruminococcus gauvreauii]
MPYYTNTEHAEETSIMQEINFETIGRKIKEIRLSKGLTQENVADAADVNTSHISNIENCRVKISLTTLVRICNALDTTVDYILAGEYSDPSSALDQQILKELLNCSQERKEKILQIIRILSSS